MPNITFVALDGTKLSTDVPAGESLMRSALHAAVPGMVAECGGELTCGTCHVYIEDQWLSSVPERSADEDELLELMEDVRDGSRLACQVECNDGLDGMIVTMARND
jgi:2Fe-2S ferredoxin